MKNRTRSFLLLIPAILALSSACTLPQAEASGAYIAAETATGAIITKNPSVLPIAQSLVADWKSYQLGTLTSAQEAGLLKQIVAATKGQLTGAQAFALDGAVQQILANQNATAPTPLQGAAAAIITDVMNGVARAVLVAQGASPTSRFGPSSPLARPDPFAVAMDYVPVYRFER